MKYEVKTKSGFDRKEHRDRRGGLLCFLFFAFFVVNSICSAQIQQAWVARYNNGITNGTHQAVKMALDTNGNIYVTGFSQNTNGGLGYATIKYAPNGNQMWVARYDSTNFPSAEPVGLAFDANGNVFVTGNALTVKYDANGNQLWTAPYAGTALAIADNTNVVVTGFGTNFDTVKLNSAGSNVWTATYVDWVGPTMAQVVLVDGNGNVYVAGEDNFIVQAGSHYQRLTWCKFDEMGNLQWTNWFMPPPTGGIKVAGTALDSTGNMYFGFNTSGPQAVPYGTMRIDGSDGGVVWKAGDPTGDGASRALGLALDTSNNVFVTGQNSYYYPNSSYGTYKINTNGAYIWSKNYPTIPTTVSVGTAIAVGPGNNVYVTGYSPGTNSGNDIVTIKYDNNGNQIWLQGYNGPGNGDDEGNAIAVDASGNVYVAGYETTAAGGTEMVVIKYAPGPFLKKEANGSFLLQAVGAAGENFDFQASTNLVKWQDLGTNTADSNGLVQFLDTNAPLFPYRFYLTSPR
jgi:hypothetical protein